MPQLSVDDILYRITDVQTMLQRPVRNIYWYVLADPAIEPSLGSIASAFLTQVVGLLDNEQSELLTHDSLLVERIRRGDDIQFLEVGSTGAGANTADPSPTFQAVGVRLVVGNRQTFPGSKRIAGLVEEDTQGNFLTSTAIGNWVTATAGMSAALAVTIGDNPSPVVVRNTITENGVTTPLNLDSWVWNLVTAVQVLTTVRHQDSRTAPIV